MKYRQASPRNEWKEYTEEHGKILRYLEQAVTDIKNKEERDPVALVGPYRTGKTQLLYEIFTYAWEEKQTPALYTSANNIFRKFEHRSEEDKDIATWLSEEVTRQAEALANGEAVDWLPNWDSPEQRDEFLSSVNSSDIDNTANAILLVDEIEQAYTTLREGDFVDDDNPLRVLLDDTTGVFQIWAFGLVSAYELGEADYARFDEQRLPILDVDNVKHTLEEHGKDPRLATGIWWLSRGRIGWTNKLVDESPTSLEGIADWVQERSEDEFEGVTPIKSNVWSDSNIPVSSWDEARRAVIFLEDSLDSWKISHETGDAISGDNISSLSLEIIEDITTVDLSGTAKGLIEENLERLTRNLVPADQPTSNEQKFLPANILNEFEDVKGFISLLSDLIVSFEGSTDARADATRVLQSIERDPSEFQSQWGERFYNYIEESEGISAWCPRPAIINQAYPPVAVDPTQLTGKSRENLENDLNRGIEVESPISEIGIEQEIRFCPNKETLFNEFRAAKKPRALNKNYILFTTQNEEDIDLSNSDYRLKDLNRVHLVPWGATRLWDFVVHLNTYLDNEHDMEPPISEHKINTAISEETNRENRSTISTLFEQLNNITETKARNGVDKFLDYYSRRDANQPIWSEDLAGTAGPPDNPPAVYGQGSISRHALAYTLACSRFDIDGFESVADISSVLYEGTQDGYLRNEGNDFGFTQFVDDTLTDQGVTGELERLWRKYRTEERTRDPSIEHFQKLMVELSIESESTDNDLDELWEVLTDMDAQEEDVPVINNTAFGGTLPSRFAWGLLLEEMAVQRNDEVLTAAQSLKESTESLKTRLEDLREDIQTKNEKLEPPDDFGNKVVIRGERIEQRESHLSDIEERIDSLIELCEDHKGFSGIGEVYNIIISSYIRGFERDVSLIEGTLLRTTLMGVDNLLGAYEQTKDEIEDNREIYEYIQMDKEEVVSEFESSLDDMFNFVKIAGSDSIPPTSQETIEEIDESTEESADMLRQLRKTIDELQRKINNQKQKQQELSEQFASLAETVSR